MCPRPAPGTSLGSSAASEFGQHTSCTFCFTSPLQVFVWVGKDSQEEEKTEALTSGEDPSLPLGLFHVSSVSSFLMSLEVRNIGVETSSLEVPPLCALPGVQREQLSSFREPEFMPGKGRKRE